MTRQALFLDIGHHLMEDETPSVYLDAIGSDPLFQEYPFDMLDQLKRTEQSPQHHPEGNVWNHTLLVVDEAARVRSRSGNQTIFMWAALLHDIGKPATTKVRKGKITAYDHDKVGAELSKDFLKEFTEDNLFINQVAALIRYHMHILYVLKNLPFGDLGGMRRNTDVNEVALLGLCDRLGRTNCDRERQEKDIQLFLQKCNVGCV